MKIGEALDIHLTAKQEIVSLFNQSKPNGFICISDDYIIYVHRNFYSCINEIKELVMDGTRSLINHHLLKMNPVYISLAEYNV